MQFVFAITLLLTVNLLSAQGFIGGLIETSIEKAEQRRKDKPKKKWPEMEHPYRLPPQEWKEYKKCLARSGKNCAPEVLSHEGLTLNLGFVGAMPLGAFATNVKSGAYGVGWGLEYQPANKVPFSTGLSMTAMFTGIKNYTLRLPFSVSANGQPLQTLAIPLDANVKNTLFQTHAVARFWAPTKFVQPYVQLLGGFLYGYTNVKLYERDEFVFLGIDNEGLIYEDRILNSISWSAGAALGLGINVHYAVNVDLRATYLHTGEMKYFNTPSISNWEFTYGGEYQDFQNRNVKSDALIGAKPPKPYVSPIQLLMFTAGITVFFE